MELLNQQFVVDFVEGFGVIEVDGIKVCIVFKRLQNIIKMVDILQLRVTLIDSNS